MFRMTSHRVVRQHTIVRIAAVLAMSVGTLLFGYAQPLNAQSGGGQPSEVVAVVDVTVEAACEVVYTAYTDETFSDVIEVSAPMPCQGGVLATVPMTEAQARAAGHAYVVLTGDPVADRVAIAQLVDEAMSSQESVTSQPHSSQTDGFMAAETCSSYRSATMSYYARNPSAWVRTTVYYHMISDCYRYEIDSVHSILLDPPDSGQDVRWRNIGYSYPSTSREMGCGELTTSWTSHYITGSGFYIYPNYLFWSEVNDGSNWASCYSGWGTSYTGSAYLYG